MAIDRSRFRTAEHVTKRPEPETMDENTLVIELKNRMAVLKMQPFDGGVDTSEILQIDNANLLGEILTFPVVFNRIANLRAEVTNALAEAKLDMDIFEAQLYEEIQRKLFAAGEKKPSIKDVEMAMLREARFTQKKHVVLKRQKDWDYIDALYWSAQSKDTKLNRLSEKVRPEDFEKDILEGSINGVMIKMTRKSIM